MKQLLIWKNNLRNIFSTFLLLSIQMVQANSSMPNLDVQVLGGGSSKAIFQGAVSQSDSDVQALIFENTIPLDINFSITVDPIDEDQSSSLYLVASYNGNWFYLDEFLQWQSMHDDLSDIKSYTSKTLQRMETIKVASDKLLGPGEYLLYAGYLNHQNKIVYNKVPLGFIVFSKENAKLHRFKSELLLSSYFKKAMSNAYDEIIVTSGSSIDSSMSGSPSSASGGASSSSNVSSTNIQEAGVDEADIIKTNGSQLFALDNCNGSYKDTCLRTYQINESPASNQFLSLYQFESEGSIGNIYHTDIDYADKSQDTIIRISSSGSFYWAWWGYASAYGQQTTSINLLDVSNPSAIQPVTDIKVDGTLISSRRINNTLYLVSRTAPYIEGYKYWYPKEPNAWVTQAEIDANAQLLEDFYIYDIMPNITIGDSSATPLHQVNNCFLPPFGSKKKLDHSIISIVAIPLGEPESYYSSCIIGATETLYTSTNAIYLASTRYEYDTESGTWEFPGSKGEYKTEIHKFALSEQELQYKGSGTIPGHLGWNYDYKPFRMSEYNDELRIATSIGSTWQENSSTSLIVLKEDEDKGTLEKIGGIDGIGKPNEYLYSSRFVATRGYLVTFERTDPLYVLNLEDGSNPYIMAELEVEGFSEYLHPIGDTHLLGIGKNAITVKSDDGSERTWQQGLKLSLFDVSAPESVSEVQSMEIGKRPTYSALFYDHHAFSFLDAFANSPARFAIPVHLYDTVPEYSYYDINDPRAYYEWTHHGLYVFDLNTIDNPGFQLSGKLITAEAIPDFQYIGPRYGHSVIQGDSIHYFYNHKLYSSAISDLD